MLHFLLLGNTQTRHRNSIWFGNETVLVHFPMQTDQSSIASTHGGFREENRLGKVLPFFIWKGLPCAIFSTWPWEIFWFRFNYLWLFFQQIDLCFSWSMTLACVCVLLIPTYWGLQRSFHQKSEDTSLCWFSQFQRAVWGLRLGCKVGITIGLGFVLGLDC